MAAPIVLPPSRVFLVEEVLTLKNGEVQTLQKWACRNELASKRIIDAVGKLLSAIPSSTLAVLGVKSISFKYTEMEVLDVVDIEQTMKGGGVPVVKL